MSDEENVGVKVFAVGETMPMHLFLSRFQKDICKGIVPAFYQRTVRVLAENEMGVTILIEPTLTEHEDGE